MQFTVLIRCTSLFHQQMEATGGEELIRHADHFVEPNGNVNEMLNVGQEDQVSTAFFQTSVIFSFSIFLHE